MRAEYFLVADAVEVYHPGKPAILGVFDIIYAKEFPCRSRPFGVIAKLIPDKGDRRKKYGLIIRLSMARRRKPMIEMRAQVQFPQKKQGVPGAALVQFMLAGVEFKTPGNYVLEVRRADNGERVCERTLYVRPPTEDAKSPRPAQKQRGRARTTKARPRRANRGIRSS